MKRIIFLICFSFLFLSLSSQGQMFNFIKPYSYVLCPEVNGVINKLGEPYSNIKITLHVEYGDSYFVYNTVTDENGRFNFDQVIMYRWFKPWKLNNNVVGIDLVAIFNGNEKDLWASYIGTLVPKEFIIDNLSNITCDLDDEKYQYDFKNEKEGGVPYRAFGICKPRGYVEKFKKDVE